MAVVAVVVRGWEWELGTGCEEIGETWGLAVGFSEACDGNCVCRDVPGVVTGFASAARPADSWED